MPSARQETAIAAYLAQHHGVIGRPAAMDLGLSPGQIRHLLRTGRWTAVFRGVYAPTGPLLDPPGRLLAACLAAGPPAVASHRSAAFLWGLLAGLPPRPQLTTAVGRHRLTGVDIWRRHDLDPERVVVWDSVPTTDPLRTLADLGEVVEAAELDEAVDTALSKRLVSVSGLEAEITRLGRQGRRGVPALRRCLERRGIAGSPPASYLEALVSRLLRSWGIAPLGVEVEVCERRYRLDFLLTETVVLEVDGYAYHWSPEAKARDSHRRNELRQAGFVVIEADWVTVKRSPLALRRTIEAALASERPLGLTGPPEVPPPAPIESPHALAARLSDRRASS